MERTLTNERIEKCKIRSDGSAFSSKESSRIQTPEGGSGPGSGIGSSSGPLSNSGEFLTLGPFSGMLGPGTGMGSGTGSGYNSIHSHGRGRSHSDLAVNDIASTVVTLNSTINGIHGTDYYENNNMYGGSNMSGKTTSSSSSSSNTVSVNTQTSGTTGLVKYNSTNSTYTLINPQIITTSTTNNTQIASNSNSKSNTKNKTTRPKSERDLNPFLGPSSGIGPSSGPGSGPGSTPGLGSLPWGARCRSQSHEAVTLTLSNPSLNAATLSGRNYFPSRPFSLHVDSEVSERE